MFASSDSLLRTTTHLLTRLNKLHRAALAPRLAALGLNVGEELMLAELWQQEGLSQGELAERLAVRPPTVTKVLRTLERLGAVERLRDPADGRVARVHLSDRGRSLRAAVEQAWREAEEELLSGMTRREVAALHDLVATVVRGTQRRH